MVRAKSQKAEELENKLQEATACIKAGLYKSPYATAKALGLRFSTLHDRVQGRSTTRQ